MKAHEFIDNYELVIARLGMWPSFHDAEVLQLALARSHLGTSKALVPTLDLHLRGWVMTPEVTAQGIHKIHGDAIFHFRFEGISDLQLEGFNHQNVLSAMNLGLSEHSSLAEHRVLRVELEQCYEFQASFVARKASVVGITPYVE
jgi:hypothetical protein